MPINIIFLTMKKVHWGKVYNPNHTVYFPLQLGGDHRFSHVIIYCFWYYLDIIRYCNYVTRLKYYDLEPSEIHVPTYI